MPEVVRLWLGQFTSKETLQTYVNAVDRFERYLGRPVEEFVEERQRPEVWGNPIEKMKSDRVVDGFFTWLRREGGRKGQPLSPNSAYGYYVAIRSLCKASGVPCGKMPRTVKKTNIFEKNWYPTQEQIMKLVDAAKSWRDKALIATMKDSGARVGLIAGLKVKDVRDQLDSGWVLTTIRDPDRAKLGFKGADVFVCGPEACEYISKMLVQREAWGEPLTGESWLFRSYANAVLIDGCEKGGKYRTKAIKRDTPSRKLNTNSIERIVVRIGRRSGIIEPKKKYARSKLHCHSFRKFFYNRTIAAGMLDIHREYLMNHAISPTQKAYFDTSHEGREEILNAYQSAYSYLSIRSPKIKDLEEQIEELRDENLRLKRRLNGFTNQIEKLEKEKKVMTHEMVRDAVIKQLSAIMGSLEEQPVSFEGEYATVTWELDEERKRKLLERLGKKPIATKKGSQFEHKLITEGELVEYLNSGWSFVETVNDRILIRRAK